MTTDVPDFAMPEVEPVDLDHLLTEGVDAPIFNGVLADLSRTEGDDTDGHDH